MSVLDSGEEADEDGGQGDTHESATKASGSRQRSARTKKTLSQARGSVHHDESSDGECFDLDGVSTSTDEEMVAPATQHLGPALDFATTYATTRNDVHPPRVLQKPSLINAVPNDGLNATGTQYAGRPRRNRDTSQLTGNRAFDAVVPLVNPYPHTQPVTKNLPSFPGDALRETGYRAGRHPGISTSQDLPKKHLRVPASVRKHPGGVHLDTALDARSCAKPSAMDTERTRANASSSATFNVATFGESPKSLRRRLTGTATFPTLSPLRHHLGRKGPGVVKWVPSVLLQTSSEDEGGSDPDLRPTLNLQRNEAASISPVSERETSAESEVDLEPRRLTRALSTLSVSSADSIVDRGDLAQSILADPAASTRHYLLDREVIVLSD
ncbi:uncharacterized protein FIBRA_07713 [Fibroporia radiculosa]|uniref:Uncharacterized protein n=1 Tax=Fibroporia radiculosa TaxID=599839 RepID=J4I173_9APHY|nr:uncharacterized protein FIBRA_07713 [Fibroporia radiculosa]CCM05492.1 predicted protein [Fibroporia radiculosa]